MLAQGTHDEGTYDQPGFHLLTTVALPAVCVGSGRKGRQRACRCDCHFLHLGTEEQKEQWEREHPARRHRSGIWLAPGVHIGWCECGWCVSAGLPAVRALICI
jgi:hypothetical protein